MQLRLFELEATSNLLADRTILYIIKQNKITFIEDTFLLKDRNQDKCNNKFHRKMNTWNEIT